MKFVKTSIPGLIICEPKKKIDKRGFFTESCRKDLFEKFYGTKISFCQENLSESSFGVLRGLHFQNPPYAQGKLVRVIEGEVIDVAVDIRKDSPTYGEYVSVKLTGENKKMFWIPEGFAHGFSSLKEGTIFSYKCTNYYNKESEGSIAWDDKDLAINWEVKASVISEKDQEANTFKELESKF